MKRIALILLCLLFTSCYNVYNITTPEMMDSHIEQTNQTIVDSGYQLESCGLDTLFMRKIIQNVYINECRYYRYYNFSKSDGTVLQYNINYGVSITPDEMYVLYIDTVEVTPTIVPEDMRSVVENISNPPKEKVKALSDATLLGSIIGIPIASLLTFFTYTALANHVRNN